MRYGLRSTPVIVHAAAVIEREESAVSREILDRSGGPPQMPVRGRRCSAVQKLSGVPKRQPRVPVRRSWWKSLGAGACGVRHSTRLTVEEAYSQSKVPKAMGGAE